MPEKRLANARKELPDGYQFGDAGRRIREEDAATRLRIRQLLDEMREPTADEPWGV